MRKSKIFLSLAFLLIKYSTIQSQINELDPVTVTSTLHPTTQSVTGRNITVIKGDQFANLPVHSLDDLLRFVPGVEVQMRGPMGSQSDIVMRGGTFQQVLVIVDGIRLNDPNTGHFSSYIPISPSEIDRIEILKGAASAVYGSEAVGGVIQIISKAFAAKKGLKASDINAQGSLGAFGLYTILAGGFWSNGKTSVSGGLISNNAQGQPLRGIDGYFHNTTASLALKHNINNDWSVALRSAIDKRDFSAQNFYTTFLSDTATEIVKSWWQHAQVKYSTTKHALKIDAGYKIADDYFLYNKKSLANQNKSFLTQALIVYNYNFNENTILTTGGNWINKKIQSNDRGNHSIHQLATFVLLQKKWGAHMTINPAFRWQWTDNNGWVAIPQMNLSYKTSRWQWRGSAGITTRDADFTELFNNYNKPLVTGGSVGNPDLLPEKSISYEVGADFLGIKNMRISSTLFRRHFDELIDFVTTPYANMPRKDNLSPSGTFALAKNNAKIISSGLETDISYSKKFAEDQEMMLSTGLTWIDTKGIDLTPSFYISSHAKFLTNFSCQYKHSLFLISITGLYKYREPRSATAIYATINKEYFIMNTMIQVNIMKKKAGLFIQADNLFNITYSDLLGSKMPGRWLLGGIKLCW